MWSKLEKEIQHFTKSEQKLIHKAYTIAERFHTDQQRESGEAYISHPVAVANILIRLQLDAETIAAALLHDVIEDTSVSQKDIKDELGSGIARLVEALTKLERVRYHGFERHVESTRKMFLAVAEDIRVVLIKLADRLHNMRTIGALRPDKQKRIAQETLELYAPLAYRLGIGEIKGELEDLAFPILMKDQHAWLVSEIKNILPKRKEYLARVAPIIKRELKREGVDFEINFRVKHYYSLWRKLQRYDLDISKVADLIALRIIVDSTEDCYRVLGLLHSLWRPVPGRIKDYIALPKPNGYQSIHTTVFCEDDVMVEFQIRTKQMHDEAEFGIAAHWVYDEKNKPKEGAHAHPDQAAWVRRLQKWQKEFAQKEGEEYIEALKIDFFKDRIFVFTPKGEVIDLPEGATPIDFAYHIHSEVGDHMTGAKVNGKMVPFSHALASGDTIEIIVQKNKTPSKDWISMAHSAMARGHIKSALRKQGIEFAKEKPKQKEPVTTIRFLCDHKRIGLLKDITTLLSRSKIGIVRADFDHEDSSKPYHTIECTLPPRCDVNKLRTRFRRIKGVRELEIK